MVKAKKNEERIRRKTSTSSSKRQLYHNQAISPQQTDPTVNKIWMRHGHRETLATKGGNRIPHTATRVNHER